MLSIDFQYLQKKQNVKQNKLLVRLDSDFCVPVLDSEH